MKDQIWVAGIQILCDQSANDMLLKAESWICKTVEQIQHLDLIILPEQFYDRMEKNCSIQRQQSLQTQFVNWAKTCAKKYQINLVAGTYGAPSVLSDSLKVRNRCLVVDRNGIIVGHYDKIHLFDAFGIQESDLYEPGEELGIFELDFGKIGVWICYDTRFPEIARALSRTEIDLMCVPAAFYRPHSEHWETLLKARAIENVTPVIGVNQYGDLSGEKGFFGRSIAIDAKGTIQAGMSDQEGYFFVNIDKKYTKQCRFANPEKNNQRPDLYHRWTMDDK